MNRVYSFQVFITARSVELGSELVACVPEKMSITMQMPRGNLETIYPRVYVISPFVFIFHS